MRISDFKKAMRSAGGTMCGVAGVIMPKDSENADGMAVAVFFPFSDPLIIVTQYGSANPEHMQKLRDVMERARSQHARTPRLNLSNRIRAAALFLRFWK